MDRKLKDYLPPVLQDVEEFEAIMESEQPEIVDLRATLKNILDDQFVESATVNGITRMEKTLKITPKANDTLAVRKFRVLTRLDNHPPFTMPVLHDKLAAMCGPDGYTAELFNDSYMLKVRIELGVIEQYEAVNDLLKRTVPANIIIDLDLRYNLYQDLEGLTYEQLEGYTYDQLRKEVVI